MSKSQARRKMEIECPMGVWASRVPKGVFVIFDLWEFCFFFSRH
jgi:hypothetical protein